MWCWPTAWSATLGLVVDVDMVVLVIVVRYGSDDVGTEVVVGVVDTGDGNAFALATIMLKDDGLTSMMLGLNNGCRNGR